jgi:hypothetical protein
MSDEPATPVEDDPKADDGKPPEDDQRVPYERFQKANKDAKEAKERAKALEQKMADLQAQLEERATAGLPELERERKQREAIEKRLADAESRAEQAERDREHTRRERWVTDAAQELNFKNPRIAAKLIDSLDDIEDSDQALRAVKKLAKSDDYLLRSEDPKLPGKVLENGRRPADDGKPKSAIDTDAEARTIADALKNFTSNWTTVGE